MEQNWIYKHTFLHGGNRAFNLGTPEAPRINLEHGFQDLADFTRHYPNAQVLHVFQEELYSQYEGPKRYKYIVFYKIWGNVATQEPV